MSDDVHTVEDFYGVYLLKCANPMYKGATYIGYTVDPNRRIKQHNKGKKAGGARRTSKKGPWVMVMIIHGFPNDVAALRFEWAWQHPQRSRRLHHVSKKWRKENTYDYQLRVLSEMLLVGPWHRLPLTIRWLDQAFARDFPVGKSPPIHMPVCYGPVVSKKLSSKCGATEETSWKCDVCSELVGNNKRLSCLSTDCELVAHVVCLSKNFLQMGEYVPVEGTCPKCSRTLLWGDIVRKYRGCNSNLTIDASVGYHFYSSDSD